MIGSSFGLGYLVATPPLHVPDELRHLRRAVQIANLGVVDGAMIPMSIERFARAAKSEARTQRRRRDTAFTLATVRRLAAIPLEPERSTYFPPDRALAYSPVVYLPAVVAVALGSRAGVRPLALLYLCRLSLLAAGLALVYVSIRVAPSLKWALCFVALLPMVGFMRSGISADTLTTGFAFLLLASILRLGEGARAVAASEVVLLASVGAALALCKMGYLPLVLATLAVPADRFASRRARWQALAVTVGVPVLVNVLWLLALGDWISTDNPGRARPDAQLDLLAEHPLRFLAALQSTWLAPDRVWRIAEGFVGRLLLLTVHPPSLLVPLCLGVLLALVAADRRARTPRIAERLVVLAAVVACLLVISVGAYLKWTSVGSTFIRGIQGRYLYPLVPFLMLALLPPHALRWRCSDVVAAILVATVTIAANTWGVVAIVAATWAAAA